MIRRTTLRILAVGLLVAAGCSGESTTTVGGDSGGGGGGGGGAAVTIAPDGTPESFFSAAGNATNQELDHLLPLPASGGASLLRRGSCGTVGLLFRHLDPSDGGTARLRYLDVTTGGAGTPEEVDPDTAVRSMSAALLFDDACAPLVLRASGEGVVEYARGADGTWAKAVVGDLAALLGEAPSSAQLVDAREAADGALTVVVRVYASGAPMSVGRGVLGTRPAAAGSAWQWTAFDLPAAATEILALAADGGQGAHALFTKTVRPCDPCDLDLLYGKLAFGGGTWSEETVQESKWGEPDDEFATHPSLAVDGAGQPVVAATFERRVVTGSLKRSTLRVYFRAGGDWEHETVASELADGYEGEDGDDYTGAQPHLVVDRRNGELHVAFTDISQWHDGNGWANGVRGQLRYAIRAGGEWTVATLYAQPGHIASPQPLHSLDTPMVASPDGGGEARLVGVERVWDTDSIYNDTDVPVTLKAMVFRATIARQ